MDDAITEPWVQVVKHLRRFRSTARPGSRAARLGEEISWGESDPPNSLRCESFALLVGAFGLRSRFRRTSARRQRTMRVQTMASETP